MFQNLSYYGEVLLTPLVKSDLWNSTGSGAEILATKSFYAEAHPSNQ